MEYCLGLCHNGIMGQAKKVVMTAVAAAIIGLLGACGVMQDALTMGLWPHSDSDDGNSSTSPAVEATATYSLAMGGVAKGRDELVIYDTNGDIANFSGKVLTFQTDNNNVELRTRDGHSDFASGSGAKIIPLTEGTTVITYFVDGKEQPDKYLVIIPPQSLIQILMGEARGQLATEAQVSGGNVELTSESPTGNAIAAVIRNRVQMLESGQPFGLFLVDSNVWYSRPNASHWDAVISARDGDAYQFTPVDPDSVSHTALLAAATREGMLNKEELIAYDQAVLTAAGVFANIIKDPTDGAFAFRTPTPAESDCLSLAMATRSLFLPAGCGPGDENYPYFAPVQILIHPSVTKLDDGRPGFVFIRNRDITDPAVTNLP